MNNKDLTISLSALGDVLVERDLHESAFTVREAMLMIKNQDKKIEELETELYKLTKRV